MFVAASAADALGWAQPFLVIMHTVYSHWHLVSLYVRQMDQVVI